MAILPAIGLLNYNGITWDSLSRSKMSGVPEYDESGRVVKWVKWTLEVDGWLGGSVALDSTLEQYRVKLTKPGMTLYYQNKGFGNLAVNRVGPPHDVNWGPKPEILNWSSLGGRQGALVTWRVTFCIPECLPVSRYSGIITLVYEVDIVIDQDNYSTRTVSGHVLIAQTRQAFTNKVKETVDQYREKIIPAEIAGFQRTVRTFKISKDRNRGDFVFTDVQLPSPLPDKMTTYQVEQSISSRLEKGFVSWDIRFNGSANAPAGSSKNDVLAAFLSTVQSRIKGLRQLISVVRVGAGGKSTLIPTSFSLGEQIYGKEVRFEYSFRLIQTGSVLDTLKATGMFLPIEGTSHVTWQKSLAANAARGNAKLAVPGGEEVLIDLCTADDKPSTLSPGLLPPPGNAQLNPRIETTLRGGQRLSSGSTLTTREASWISYSVELRTITTNRTARHKRLPVENPDKYRKSTKGSADPTKVSALQAGQSPGDRIPEEKAATADVVQVLGSPSYDVVLTGMARRIEHQVAVPRLLSIQGTEAVQIDADVRHWTDGAVGGVPIHVATWSIRYMLTEKYPIEVPELANPQLGTSSDVA